MNKIVKSVLTIAGLALLGYGIYILVAPEAAVSIGDFSIKAQDNTNAYITIGLGIVALAIGLMAGKK